MTDATSEGPDATRRRQDEEAARCAAICFDPAERIRRLAAVGRSGDAPFAVLARNQFVPLRQVPQSAQALSRRGDIDLDKADLQALGEHAQALDAGVEAAVAALRAGETHEHVREECRSRASWPALGLADSEQELRSLLMLQFDRMRQEGVKWRSVGSGVFSIPTPGGLLVLVDFYSAA